MKAELRMHRDIFIERRTGSGLILPFVYHHHGANGWSKALLMLKCWYALVEG